MKVTFGRHTCRCRIRVRWESGSLVSRVHTYALAETSNALGYLQLKCVELCLVMDFHDQTYLMFEGSLY